MACCRLAICPNFLSAGAGLRRLPAGKEYRSVLFCFRAPQKPVQRRQPSQVEIVPARVPARAHGPPGVAIRANLGSIAPKLRAGVKVSAIGATGRRAGSHAQLSVMLPRDVVRQVKGRAAERGETLRVAVLRALAARGYPTGQARSRPKSGPMRVIMAGPFADRQALIRALNDLRANGYPGAVAR